MLHDLLTSPFVSIPLFIGIAGAILFTIAAGIGLITVILRELFICSVGPMTVCVLVLVCFNVGVDGSYVVASIAIALSLAIAIYRSGRAIFNLNKSYS